MRVRGETGGHRGRTFAAFVAAGICAAALIAPGGAFAATFQVDSTGDPVDTNPTGTTCDIGAPTHACTLRAAMRAAGFNSDPTDTITFAPGIGSTITLQNTFLPSTPNGLTIQGPGAGQLTIDGNGLGNVLQTQPGQTINMSGLTITGGEGGGNNAGGITNAGATLNLDGMVVTGNKSTMTNPNSAVAVGGGLTNSGTLHLIRSTVSGNTATAAATAALSNANATGGGIWDDANATLTLDHSTVSGNTAVAHNTAVAPDPGNAAEANGGGIYLEAPFGGNHDTLSLDRSTVGQNTAVSLGQADSEAFGGGIFDHSGATGIVGITSSTLTANAVQANGSGTPHALGGANILMNSSNGETIKNTIVSAGDGPSNCAGGFVNTSAGFNMEDVASCGFISPGDQPNAGNINLGPLGDNGGATKTYALQTGSAAIDAGLSSPGETNDQRELTRPVDLPDLPNAPGSDGTDIGAFEVQPSPPPPPNLPDNTFTIGKVKGKKVSVTVPGEGRVDVTDANAQKKKLLLKPSTTTAGGAGTVQVTLKLTKTAKKKLKKKHKVKVKASFTFTPTGGNASTQAAGLKVKK